MANKYLIILLYLLSYLLELKIAHIVVKFMCVNNDILHCISIECKNLFSCSIHSIHFIKSRLLAVTFHDKKFAFVFLRLYKLAGDVEILQFIIIVIPSSLHLVLPSTFSPLQH